MTLNGVIALILRFFPPISVALQADYVTVVEDRPDNVCKISSPSPSRPLSAKTNPPCSAVSAIAELLVERS